MSCRLAVAVGLAAFACSSPPPAADWVLALDPNHPSEQLSPALLGHYDLSGALFGFDRVPGLIDSMRSAGFAEWRVGVGRWELGTRLLPSLTQATPPATTDCRPFLALLPPEAAAPAGATDLDLMATRDWFTYTDGQPVTLAMTADDARYQLGYVRSVVDVATAFGVPTWLDVDLMPRALAIQPTPARVAPGAIPDPCFATFTNHVSNAAPRDAAIFAQAVVGLIRRLASGSGGQPGRALSYVEIWNEPEFAYFWDQSFEPSTEPLQHFFQMAFATLAALDAWRTATPSAAGLKFGLGSFGHASTAAALIGILDKNPVAGRALPVDFFSFHGYDNDPLAIAAGVQQVADARRASTSYRNAELALSEWGLDLTGRGWTPNSMDAPLHAATVLALGAAAGLTHAHRAIFYDSYAAIVFGLVDHTGAPAPVHRAYELLAKVVGTSSQRLAPANAPDGRLDGGMGAVLASIDASRIIRVLVANRQTVARTVRVDVGGTAGTPRIVTVFDDPAGAPRVVPAGTVVRVPGRGIVLIEMGAGVL